MADAEILDLALNEKEQIAYLKKSLFKYSKIIAVFIVINFIIQISFYRIGELSSFVPRILFSNLIGINLIAAAIGTIFGKIQFKNLPYKWRFMRVTILSILVIQIIQTTSFSIGMFLIYFDLFH